MWALDFIVKDKHQWDRIQSSTLRTHVDQLQQYSWWQQPLTSLEIVSKANKQTKTTTAKHTSIEDSLQLRKKTEGLMKAWNSSHHCLPPLSSMSH